MENKAKETIQQLIDNYQLDKAEASIQAILALQPEDDEAYLLMGNIQRKRSNWKEALQNYAQAIELNPDSPALHAREMIIEIMNFYDKERYNV